MTHLHHVQMGKLYTEFKITYKGSVKGCVKFEIQPEFYCVHMSQMCQRLKINSLLPMYLSKVQVEDGKKFCDLLRISELYPSKIEILKFRPKS